MGLFGKKNRKQVLPAWTTSAEPNPESVGSTEQLPTAADPVKELERLEGLRDRGMLSPDEFAIEKRKILASQSYRRI